MKKTIFPLLLLLFSMKTAAQCPGPFSIPYVMDTEEAETPELPDCMSTNYLTFASDLVFESIPGPVEGFDGKLLAYDTYAEESTFVPYTGASLTSYQIELEAGVNYVMACRFGLSEGDGSLDYFNIQLTSMGVQPIDLAYYTDIPGGSIGDFESNVFTVPTSGFYRLSFSVDTEANQGLFYLDDIALYEEGMMGRTDNLLADVAAYVEPSSGKLVITAENVLDKLEMFSMTGQKIHSETIGAQVYETGISHLSQGIYLLTIHSGDKTKRFKIYKP